MSGSALTGRRVLCVEDETLIAMLLEDILIELGCEVIGPFASVAPALHALESTHVDAAVLDVNLRGRRSYAVADALTRMGRPFVFITGYGEEGLDPAYRGAAVVQKPFSAEKVAEALERARWMAKGT